MITRAILIAAFAFAPLLPPPTAAAERWVEGNRVTEGVPELPERITERMRQYQNTRSASVRGWTSNGDGLLISTRFGETNQLHLVEKPGGARRQLTFFAEPVRSAAVCPALRRREFLFSKDVGGGESYQIYLFDMDSGEYAMVTDGASRNGYALWSDAGDRFVYYSTRRNGRDWDIVLSHAAPPGRRRPFYSGKAPGFPSTGRPTAGACWSNSTSPSTSPTSTSSTWKMERANRSTRMLARYPMETLPGRGTARESTCHQTRGTNSAVLSISIFPAEPSPI